MNHTPGKQGAPSPGRGIGPVSLLLALDIVLAGFAFWAPMPTTGDGPGGAVELTSFDVPEKVRAGKRFVATTTVQNNGTGTVRELEVVFKREGLFVNKSTVKELLPGNSTAVWVEMWPGPLDGVEANFTVEAAGRMLALTRLVLAPEETYINIIDFAVRPDRIEPGEDMTQDFVISLTLENRGEVGGTVNYSVWYLLSGIKEIVRDEVSVNGSSLRNLTISWTFKGRIPAGIVGGLSFNANLSGDDVGNRSRAQAACRIFSPPPALGFDWRPPTVMVGLVLVVLAVLLLDYHRRRAARKSDRAPQIRKKEPGK